MIDMSRLRWSVYDYSGEQPVATILVARSRTEANNAARKFMTTGFYVERTNR